MQQTFLSAHAALPTSEGPMHVRAWLFAIARNHCISMLRRRRDDPTGEPLDVATACVAEQVQQREELRALVHDLKTLPDEQRAAILLTSMGALSHRDTARILGGSHTRVTSLVFRGRESLLPPAPRARRTAPGSASSWQRSRVWRARAADSGATSRSAAVAGPSMPKPSAAGGDSRSGCRGCPGSRRSPWSRRARERRAAPCWPRASRAWRSSSAWAQCSRRRPAAPSSPCTSATTAERISARRRRGECGAGRLAELRRGATGHRPAGRDARGACRTPGRAVAGVRHGPDAGAAPLRSARHLARAMSSGRPTGQSRGVPRRRRLLRPRAPWRRGAAPRRPSQARKTTRW